MELGLLQHADIQMVINHSVPNLHFRTEVGNYPFCKYMIINQIQTWRFQTYFQAGWRHVELRVCLHLKISGRNW